MCYNFIKIVWPKHNCLNSLMNELINENNVNACKVSKADSHAAGHEVGASAMVHLCDPTGALTN